jgi:SIR2-like domain
MRFLSNGPSIPDELLIARDEGRVVFFCGAGVSMAHAGLSDFFGLADEVIRKLGVAPDSPVCKILKEAGEIEKRTGVSGLISVDRVFGLLEREFLVRDIQRAVAEALRPDSNADLTAHRILLDLSTTAEGKVRLVTTNFDRLFEDCDDALDVWRPPNLPDPSRQDEMEGIIHLHGCATNDYDGSEGEGFILSSSEFGRAYLSEGWATEFFKEIVSRYVVVFVGYTADDPPVQYLLEALNRKVGQLTGVYAFQAGSSNEASARWLHKGIEAIAYSPEDKHKALWETLAAWAQRAKAPAEWYRTVIDLAKKGPENLQPHERGQVAHVVSTVEGVRKFSEGESPPPADWLCVFDRLRRYGNPGYTGEFGERGPYVDPFDLYGLDSDVAPKKIDPENPYEKRDAPETAWDGLAANRLDQLSLRENGFSAIRGRLATNVPRLAPRLAQLGEWIAKVADQPTTVWWAAHQNKLHPDVQGRIRWELERSNEASTAIRQAWRYLFEAWDEKPTDFYRDWHDLKAVIAKDGWNRAAVRKFVAINRPYLKAERNHWHGPKPPGPNTAIRVRDMVRLDVEYPNPPNDTKVPDEWLEHIVQGLRKNLERALDLETELGGYRLNNIDPIISEDPPADNNYGRIHGLSGSVISFSSYFERLIKLDVHAASRELAAWPINDETIFSRLKIWATGIRELVPGRSFCSTIVSLSDNAFWSGNHQRDLLLVLAKRWNELKVSARRKIEVRLLKGPSRFKNEEDVEFEKRKAWSSLSRLTWLASNGCNFSFDLETELKELQRKAVGWKPEYAVKAAESRESRGGWVRTETEHSSLLREPLSSTLSKALELSRRTEDFLVERDPFAGLSAERPVRAFAALADAAKQSQYPEWAWRTFLSAQARNNDKPKFSALIAERLSRYPNEAVAAIIGPASDWLLSSSEKLASRFPGVFDKIMSKLIDVLRSQASVGASSLFRGSKEPDWAMEAINSPVGKIARALFNDPRISGLKVGDGIPAEWLALVNRLLSLSDNLYRYALVTFAHNLNWFYDLDPNWTEANLLSVLDGESGYNRAAIWSGFLLGTRGLSQDLYARVKPTLLAAAKTKGLLRREYGEVLAGIILAGWGSRDAKTQARFVANGEMRDVLLEADDDFRSRILWQIERWLESQELPIAETWSQMFLELLRDVWPRQKSAKTPTISARLCELAFSNVKLFPQIADLVLPLLTNIDREHLMLPNLSESKDNIADLYPHQALALLYAVLPENVTLWPYGIKATLERIGEAANDLRKDERFLELNRKWNAR